MARNDRILLDGIIDDRVSQRLPSDKRDEVFEYLAIEQILKEYDLSSDEIEQGWIDKDRDGGIDGFYILINGHLLRDPESFSWPKTGSELTVFIISCKHHDTFKQATLDKLIATISEVFNFELEDSQLKGTYSDQLLRMRGNFCFAYRKLSLRVSNFKVSVAYASRGDTAVIGEEVDGKAKQLKALIQDLFGICEVSFRFVGSSELVDLTRKIPNYTLELPFVEALSKGERYVVLAKLSDYFQFVSQGGALRRYLFESNVRDFMGLNRVNEDIRTTLKGSSATDFWWLNNGVTILANSARIVGKSIQATDIQIVNGLQTTESIFRYFQDFDVRSDERCVLIKVIVSQDDEVRDSIIRATNNQTAVELASLHATDKIQRDIEDVFLRSGLFYERRKNHYLNLGHSTTDLVTPLYLAAGYIALFHKLPYKSITLRSKFMRSSEAYLRVFSDAVPVEVWPKIARLLKGIDSELEKLRPTGRSTDKYLKSWRYLCAFFTTAKAVGRVDFDIRSFAALDIERTIDQEFHAVWNFLQRFKNEERQFLGWTSPKRFMEVCRDFSSSNNLPGIEHVEKMQDNLRTRPQRAKDPTVITDDFVRSVREAMPPQPWKPGVNRQVCAQLGCEREAYAAAVEHLIDEGVFHRQKDGVLYDPEGNVIAFDPERVDPETLQLLKDGY